MSSRRPFLAYLGTEIIRDGMVGLEMVRKKLWAKSNIVIISGAGISTNAGTYSIPDSTAKLHSYLLSVFVTASESKFTPFERLMEDLARYGRIRRHYTQNFDCRSTRLPSLSQKTICLHGRLDTMMCHMYSQHKCQEYDQQLVEMGKRSRSGGFLRTQGASLWRRMPQ
ncbi:hypothetical protein K469DRAFT_681566 [Zopfia rhizophila CBS 207.26]|uniref:Uncharacterized protein n=1 Tax=Zopfia rhizophila CBS 207.26 TaxID=1314779 RepID=A0A6A6EVC6_9PEZI|nr:hypothetical protein K469DRAFT_681566 [Zopfia rhizophila CBS 207.26]